MVATTDQVLRFVRPSRSADRSSFGETGRVEAAEDMRDMPIPTVVALVSPDRVTTCGTVPVGVSPTS
jgi:hypothetical protein